MSLISTSHENNLKREIKDVNYILKWPLVPCSQCVGYVAVAVLLQDAFASSRSYCWHGWASPSAFGSLHSCAEGPLAIVPAKTKYIIHLN